MASREVVKQEIQVSPHEKLVVTLSWCKSCGICMELCPMVSGVVKPESLAKAIPSRFPERNVATALDALNIGVKLPKAVEALAP